MCGIAGIINTEPNSVVEAATIHRMCQTIVHRGPDDEGIYAKGGVGLGMRRLSIIDLAGGHQPVHNEDQSVWIVFNGEIYNFPELRPELEARGHHFYTNTDTEVIVHLYEDFGADCVQKLRGMFAIALYDERRRRLLLTRDRLGKKPLHYAIHNGRLLFASEIKAILAVAPELAEVNPQGLLGYFSFGYIPDPETAFVRIHKLPPGHWLELADGKSTVRQYWDLPAYGAHEPASEEECLEELEHRLAEAVRIRLIADVPLGALLSGGTDSSTVVALMARASSKPVKTFSIGFRKEDFNETHYARLVAKRFGTEHHELIVEPDFAQTLETLTRSLEEPFADSSMLPTYYVSRLARQHVTVALSGDGGDELFAGYERYPINLQRRKFDAIPKWAGRWYRRLIDPVVPHAMYGRRLAYNLSLPWPDRYIDGLSLLPMFGRERSFFARDFLESAANGEDPSGLYRSYALRAPAHDSLSQLMYLDTKTYLPGDILTKVDRMSMATSLEVRVPILDHVFAEWVTGLPAAWKLRDGRPKYILRKLAERVGVPPEVLHRPKQGFSLPLVHWLRDELKGELPRLLLEPRSLQRGYFEPRAVRRLLDEHFRERRNHTFPIWLLLVLELWHRNYLGARSDFPTATAAPEILMKGARMGERGKPAAPSTPAALGEITK
jgi:asparagine synthase (glutamine-hydrolysing)